MIARNEIDTIETFFEQYCSYQSDIMFNYHTDRFFDNILSLGFVKDVVDTLMIKYPIDEKELACRQCLEWFSFYKEIISQGHEYYLSYCIHYFQYLRNKDNPFQPYFDEIIWTDKSATENGDRPTLFKTDFVRPIIDYIINLYSAENHIIFNIKRYSERVERFRELVGMNDEKEIQKHFAKYLFDTGCNFYRESNTNNGQLDFYIESLDGAMRSSWQCQEGQYIVEIKVFNDIIQIQKGMSQLIAYTNQINAHGCLLVFTDKELTFHNVPEGIIAISTYIGDKTPSKRDKVVSIEF